MIYSSTVSGRPESTVSMAQIDLKKERYGFVCEHYVMVLLLRGNGRYIAEDSGESYDLEEGVVYQRFPGRSHAQVFDTDDNQQFFLRVPRELFLLMDERGQLNKNPVLKLHHKPVYKAFHQCYLDCMRENDGAYALWRLRDVILELHQWSREIQPISEMDRALNFMEKMTKKRLSLDELAKKFNMSTISFRRHFKAHTGVSPGAWMIQRRIAQATEMLSNDYLSIEDIAHYFTYPDVYSFSKQFKKEIGVSPSEFRKSANF